MLESNYYAVWWSPGDFMSIRRKIAGLTVIIWWTGKVEVWRGEPLKSEYIGAFMLKKRAISQR